MEEIPRGDTVPVTPEHPMTPLEQMEEDDMRRLHPILPSNPRLNISNEERGALRAAHDALQIAAGLEGTNANPSQERITDLVRPEDPPISRAFVQELENWPEIDQFLEEAFRER